MKITLLIATLLLINISGWGQTIATTNDGRLVILNDDGTYILAVDSLALDESRVSDTLTLQHAKNLKTVDTSAGYLIGNSQETSIGYLGINKVNQSEAKAFVAVGQKIRIKCDSESGNWNGKIIIKGELTDISDSTIKIRTKQKKTDDQTGEFIDETIYINSIKNIRIESLSKSERKGGAIISSVGTGIAEAAGGTIVVGTGMLLVSREDGVQQAGVIAIMIAASVGTLGLLIRRLGIATKYDKYKIGSKWSLTFVEK